MRVYTHYSDGCTWISEQPSATWAEIPAWQWLAYRMFRWVCQRVNRWEMRLDSEAYRLAEKEGRA